MMGHPSRFTLVKGQGGLGNRMLSVMTATLYSLIMKRRMYVDWRDPIYTGRSIASQDLFQDLFISSLVDPLPDRLDFESVAPAMWRGRLEEMLGVVGREYDPDFYKKFNSFTKLGVRLKPVDYPEELIVFWSWREVMRPLRPLLVRLDDRYRKMTNVEILGDTAKKFLQPCERVQSLVNEFTATHFQPRMLGLHIRATDLQAPTEKILAVAQRQVLEQGCDGVFCATDNADVEDRVRSLFPNVVTLPKGMARGGIPLHYDPECGDRVERATQALVDILLLSRCNALVYASRSSFGYVASLYANQGQFVVDVDAYNPIVQMKRIAQSFVY